MVQIPSPSWGGYRTLECHCEPVTDVTGVAIRQAVPAPNACAVWSVFASHEYSLGIVTWYKYPPRFWGGYRTLECHCEPVRTLAWQSVPLNVLLLTRLSEKQELLKVRIPTAASRPRNDIYFFDTLNTRRIRGFFGCSVFCIEVTASCTRTSGIRLFRSAQCRKGDSDPQCLPACIPETQHSHHW